jgi:hypothetical protein
MKTLRFPLAATAALLAASFITMASVHAETPAAKTVVEGTFLGDGKDGKLKYLVVQPREPFSDQEAIRLIFTEKDPSGSKKPDFDAGFKKLGSALVVSVHRDGGVFGCEVAHSAHEKSPFSAVGQIKIEDFQVTDTTVSGRLTTGGEDDAFGQTWNVDLKFSAPLPPGAFAASSTPAPTPAEEKDEPAAAAGPKLPVGELPLPASALDVEFRKPVGQIGFRSDASVSAVTEEFSKALKQQGWKDGPGNLATKMNAILKRERDGASLTIMIQPSGKGCKVMVMTEGLDWTDTPASAAPAKPANADGAAGIEVDVNQLINNALKQVPGGR